MIAFATAQFELAQTIPGSKPPTTKGEYLRSMVEQNDADSIAEMEAMPKLPRLGAHLWEWFIDPVTGLHATRRTNGMGASRLSRAEIRAWEHDEGVALERWERRALMAIDAAWAKAASDDLAAGRGAGE